jgi:hypothetical protein
LHKYNLFDILISPILKVNYMNIICLNSHFD